MGLREVLEICLALIGSAEDQDKFETLYEKYKKLLYHACLLYTSPSPRD